MKGVPIAVTVSRGNEKYSFDTCRQAARFIAEREHYATGSIKYYFGKRREEVHGWKINYQR